MWILVTFSEPDGDADYAHTDTHLEAMWWVCWFYVREWIDAMIQIRYPRDVRVFAGEKEVIRFLNGVWEETHPCKHEGWSFEKHGRGCIKCGAMLMDAGD